jgi:hypothetical protein
MSCDWFSRARYTIDRDLTDRLGDVNVRCSLNCSDVLADSVTINGDLRWPNNDGIDVTSCNDTIIRDCSITTGAQQT